MADKKTKNKTSKSVRFFVVRLVLVVFSPNALFVLALIVIAKKLYIAFFGQTRIFFVKTAEFEKSSRLHQVFDCVNKIQN